jgi:hypothetical protein
MIFDLLHAGQENQGLNSLSFTFPQVSGILRFLKMVSDLFAMYASTRPGSWFPAQEFSQLSPMLRVPAVGRNAETVRPGEQDGSKTRHYGVHGGTTAVTTLTSPVTSKDAHKLG